MKLPLNQLAAHLDKGLSGLYLVAADEPLLVAEATDRIRRAAMEQGFDERKVFFVERGFRWEQIEQDGDNLSLFASRRIVEIRMATPKPGDAGGKAIRALAENPDPDRIVIVSIQARMDASVQRSVWARTVEKHGVLVDIRPVSRQDLPRFIAARAKARQLVIDPDAAELLADRVEGNLLAADQELTKLKLISDGDRVDSAAVMEAVAMSARYDIFRLSDAILAGDLKRGMTVLAGLRSEGVAPPLVLWAIAREIMVLAQLKRAEARGERLDPLMSKLRIWQSRQSLVRRALSRYSVNELVRLMTTAARTDRIVKGQERAPVWEAITDLVLQLLAPTRKLSA